LRAKYILGHINLYTKTSKTALETTESIDTFRISTKFDIITNAPINLTLDQDGLPTGTEIESESFNSIAAIKSNYLLSKNRGYGVDLGAIYKFDDRITFNASIVDLGFINWKANSKLFSVERSIYWSGVSITNEEVGEAFANLGDSLLSIVEKAYGLNPVVAGDRYIISLPTKLYLGATYQLHPKVLFGAVNRTMLLKNRPHTSFTLSANLKPVKFLNTTIVYSMMDNTYNNLGFGFALGNRGAQFYMLFDKIPLTFAKLNGAPIPYSGRTFTTQFGFNVIFGCKPPPVDFDELDACGCHWVRESLYKRLMKNVKMKRAKEKYLKKYKKSRKKRGKFFNY